MTNFVAFTPDLIEHITDCVGSALTLLEKHPEEIERAKGYLETAMSYLDDTELDDIRDKIEAEEKEHRPDEDATKKVLAYIGSARSIVDSDPEELERASEYLYAAEELIMEHGVAVHPLDAGKA